VRASIILGGLALAGSFGLSADLTASSEVRSAIAKALPPLQKAGPGFWAGSGCISCHHQSLPAMAVAVARERGLAVDEAAAAEALKLSVNYMDARRERMRQGIVPPGATDTMAYILFGLTQAKFAGDEATEAGVRYLKVRQAADGSWIPPVHRPPLEFSGFTYTALCIRVLDAFAPGSQRAEYEASMAKGANWLETHSPQLNEDFAFQILGLKWARKEKEAKNVIARTASALVKRQQSDGGWRQIPSLETDAYATGQALVALEASGMKTSDPVYRKGIEFLLRTQNADGSWHVISRAEPVQIYFETGFPYGKDQFISAAGTSWAITALALAEPPVSGKAARGE